MEIKASLKHFHISPRKMRLGANLIKGMDAKHAELELARLSKHAAIPLLKLLRSALANAANNLRLDTSGLYVKGIQVNSGVVLKRFRPRAFGRAATIRKKTCHVFMVLDTTGEVSLKDRQPENENTPSAKGIVSKDAKKDLSKTPKRKNITPDPKANKVEKKGFTKKIFSRKVV